MASSLMATAAATTRSTPFLKPTALFLLAALISRRAGFIPNRRRAADYSLHTQFRPLELLSVSSPSKSRISAAAPENPKPVQDLLSGSTRTTTTLAAVALTASKPFADGLFSMAVQLKEPVVRTAGPAFFAAMNRESSGSLNTPLTVVAAGMVKWLDIYSTVLSIRVMLTWFPNIPWDKQPLVAMKDLCDPYLNLFKNIVPPIFDALDISPLLAFAVLGVLGSILKTSL